MLVYCDSMILIYYLDHEGPFQDRATHLRATRQLKTVDALHLAAAIEAGCDVFLTNDTRLGDMT